MSTRAGRQPGTGAGGGPGQARDRRALPLQIRDRIRELIRAEDLQPGEQLPTEAEFAERFGVARTTAREALKLLEQDGVIDVRHGLGRYVSQLATLERPITRLESVTEMMASRGLTVTNRVLSVEVGAATEEEASALDVARGTEVIRLERVRIDRGEPIIYSIDIFPRSLIDGPIESIDWSTSLVDHLEEAGSHMVSASTQIQAARLPPAGERAAGTGQDPWILMVQRNIDDMGRPMIYSHDYYRGSRFAFNVIRRREE